MPTILYKCLVEVRIMHEYYLIGADGSNFFDFSPDARRTYLREQVAYGHYKLLTDLTIEPTAATQRLLTQYQLKFSLTYTGYVIGIEVDEHLSEDTQASSFRPRNILPDGLVFEFLVSAKNPSFRNFTNTRQRTIVPAIYVLDSADPRNLFPNLATPVANFTDQTSYETGELAAFTEAGVQVVKQAQQTTRSDRLADWQTISPAQGFLNELDRRLLPKRFYVNLPGTDKIRVEATLRRVNGDDVVTIVQESKGRAWFDFSRPAKTTNELPNDNYDLTITSSTPNAVLFHKNVYLSDSYNPAAFALIRLHHGATLGAFSLLRNGALIFDSSATEDPHLIFEIWIQSRLTYWRYTSKTGKPLPVQGPLPGTVTLSPDKDYIETRKPYSLRSKQTAMQTLDPPLPNPLPDVIRETSPPRQYTYVDTPIFNIRSSVIHR